MPTVLIADERTGATPWLPRATVEKYFPGFIGAPCYNPIENLVRLINQKRPQMVFLHDWGSGFPEFFLSVRRGVLDHGLPWPKVFIFGEFDPDETDPVRAHELDHVHQTLRAIGATDIFPEPYTEEQYQWTARQVRAHFAHQQS